MSDIFFNFLNSDIFVGYHLMFDYMFNIQIRVSLRLKTFLIFPSDLLGLCSDYCYPQPHCTVELQNLFLLSIWPVGLYPSLPSPAALNNHHFALGVNEMNRIWMRSFSACFSVPGEFHLMFVLNDRSLCFKEKDWLDFLCMYISHVFVVAVLSLRSSLTL